VRQIVSRLASLLFSGLEFGFGSSRYLSIWRAKTLLMSGRYLDSVRYVTTQLRLWPDSADLHYLAGQAAIRLVNFDYARVRMAYATALSPAETRFRFALAYCAHREGDKQTAEREYRIVLLQTPTDLNARLNLGLVLKSQNKHALAIDAFEEVVMLRPKDVKALFGAAVCHYQLGEMDNARRKVETCVQIQPNHGKSYSLLGSIALADHQSETAKKHYERAMLLEPEDGATLAALGRLYMIDNPAHGRHLLREALIVARQDRSAHFDLGQYYERTHQLDRALAEYALYARYHNDTRSRWSERRIERIREKQLEST
jgi:Flp pilus assembly protein TadD